MKKPKPRTSFRDAVDEWDHLVSCLCWLEAAKYPGPGSQEQVADEIKHLVDTGQFIIDVHPDGDRVRLIPSI